MIPILSLFFSSRLLCSLFLRLFSDNDDDDFFFLSFFLSSRVVLQSHCYSNGCWSVWMKIKSRAESEKIASRSQTWCWTRDKNINLAFIMTHLSGFISCHVTIFYEAKHHLVTFGWKLHTRFNGPIFFSCATKTWLTKRSTRYHNPPNWRHCNRLVQDSVDRFQFTSLA